MVTVVQELTESVKVEKTGGRKSERERERQ